MLVEATQVDSDSDEFPSKLFTCVQQGKRRKATRIHSESEASAQFSGGRFARLSSVRARLTISLSEMTKLMRRCQRRSTAVVDGLEQDFCATHPQRFTQCRKERNAHQQQGLLGDRTAVIRRRKGRRGDDLGTLRFHSRWLHGLGELP